MPDVCIARVLNTYTPSFPNSGYRLPIDSSDVPANANGQRFLSKNGPKRERFSEADASRGHRSAASTRRDRGNYSFELHASRSWQRATRTRTRP